MTRAFSLPALAGLLLSACDGVASPFDNTLGGLELSVQAVTFASIGDSVAVEVTLRTQPVAGGVGQFTSDVHLVWSSSAVDVVSVGSSGVLVSEGNGEAVVRVSAPVYRLEDSISVTVRQEPASIRLHPSPADTLRAPGDTITFEADAEDARGVSVEDLQGSWSIEPPGVLAPAGESSYTRQSFVAVGNGIAVITLEAGDVFAEAEVVVAAPGAVGTPSPPDS